MNLLGPILAVAGAFVGVWAIFKYVILVELRLDSNTYKTLYEVCKAEKKFVIREEFVSEAKPPVIFAAICFFQNAPWFFLHHSERLLTAGWSGKDYVTVATCFRWRYKKLKSYFGQKLKEMQLDMLGVPVELITPNYTDRIGVLKRNAPPPLAQEDIWKDIENEVAEVFAGKREKTSALLYGPPGNGKTSFIKYLATKYRVPIKVITFDSQFNNHDLMAMFSQITPNSIVLFEDFDNYFNGRECILGSGNTGIRFTFDIILNGLDGVYNTYENVVFLMTVNDINKVDYALKNRPSRFKYVRQFGNPTVEMRQSILPGWEVPTDGLNLDQILRLKEFRADGLDLSASMKKLEKDVKQEEVAKIAYKRYEERLASGIQGTADDDWIYALNRLK